MSCFKESEIDDGFRDWIGIFYLNVCSKCIRIIMLVN